MKYRKRRLPWVLMVLGALMALSALIMLLQTPNVLQYIIQAPAAGEGDSGLGAVLEKARETRNAQYANYRSMAIDGTRSSISLSTEKDTVEANLIAIDEGWLEVYPRFLKEGRRISEIELQHGTAVAMLDEGLIIKLYGSALPEEATVKINDVEYRVVGAVKHGGSVFGGRGVADALEFDVYIPLQAAVTNGIALETLKLSAQPFSGSGWANTFQISVKQWTSSGQLIDLPKEALGGMMLLRILLLIVGLYALVGLFNRLTDRVMGWFHGYSMALKQHYFKELIPRLLGIVALTLLCYGALVGATWLLLSFSVQPVYTFTEWVPENFVEWSSITKVFWNLVSSSAGLVRVSTRELRIVQFWSALLRWGVILTLLGAALLPKAWHVKNGK